MGKTACMIQILTELSPKSKKSGLNTDMLSEDLGISVRNISEYIKDLNCSDYITISSAKGRNSCYYIDSEENAYSEYRSLGQRLLPSFKLTENEQQAIVEAYRYSMSKPDFMYKKELKEIAQKVFPVCIDSSIRSHIRYVRTKGYDVSEKQLENYRLLKQAIEERRIVSLKNQSQKDGLIEMNVEPYDLVNYNGNWYLIANDREHDIDTEFAYIRLDRIQGSVMLSFKTFNRYMTYSLSDYFSPKTGFKTRNEKKVIITAKGFARQWAKKHAFGKMQEIKTLDEETDEITFMKRIDDFLVSFLIKNGNDVKVLEPLELVEMMKKELEAIADNYTDIQ